VARTRDWYAFSAGSTATPTVNGVDMLGGAAAVGSTLQRIVGVVDLQWYATGAEARITDVQMGIRIGNALSAPNLTNVNSQPETWMWFQHRRMGRTITAATAGEFRYAFMEIPIDVQGMRLLDGISAWFNITRTVANSGTNTLTWLISGRALLLNP
jgi:hypothetical protein